ncbi:unnamed protein product [Auanema sp. JU1783]|nr:unnamed protein product [Auanema sp. JU1783]
MLQISNSDLRKEIIQVAKDSPEATLICPDAFVHEDTLADTSPDFEIGPGGPPSSIRSVLKMTLNRNNLPEKIDRLSFSTGFKEDSDQSELYFKTSHFAHDFGLGFITKKDATNAAAAANAIDVKLRSISRKPYSNDYGHMKMSPDDIIRVREAEKPG